MDLYQAFISIIIITGAILSVITHKLTVVAAACGALIAAVIFYCSGSAALSFMTAFFLIAVMATRYKSKLKTQQGFSENSKGRRNAGQVFANAGAAAIFVVTANYFDDLKDWVPIATAAVFASASADTVSSEMGNVTGKKFYNILNFRRASPGGNGVISLEGTAWGIAASAMIAALYALWYGWNQAFFFIIIAGTAGNIADSILGATLENKKLLDNNAVNFMNTCFAALVAILLAKAWL